VGAGGGDFAGLAACFGFAAIALRAILSSVRLASAHFIRSEIAGIPDKRIPSSPISA